MRSLLPLAALGLALAPAIAVAQPDDRSQLPSLTPAVFESRGVIAVTLPVVERQPLSGFGPLPRRYVVPAEREPIEQPFAPDLDALPALALAPPPEPPVFDVEVHRLRAEGGAGLYLGRYGRLDLSAAGAAGEFFVDADYDGVSGENPDLGDDDWVRLDRVEVRAGGRSFAPGRVRLEGHALLDGYSAPAFGTDSRRLRRMVGAEASLSGVGPIPYALTVGFEQGRLSRLDGSEETDEGRVDASGRIALLGERVLADAAAGTSGAGTLGTDLQYGAAGLAVSLSRPNGLRVTLGARALAYEATAAAGSGDARAVGPIVDVELPLGPTVRAFVQNDPHLAVRSLTDLTEDNPYVLPDPVVAPDVFPVDARAGLELRPGGARARIYAHAFLAPTYLAFEEVGGAYRADYYDASAYGLGADLSVTSRSGVSASAGIEVRTEGRVDGGEIPFFAPLVGRAGLQVPFADGRGRVGLAAHAESARPTDSSALIDAPAYGRLSLDARYEVLGPLAAVLRGQRLLGEAERWPGYPEPPFTVLVGLRLAR